MNVKKMEQKKKKKKKLHRRREEMETIVNGITRYTLKSTANWHALTNQWMERKKKLTQENTNTINV